MITYKVVQGAPGFGFHVVVKESGAVVAGPFTMREQADERAVQLALQNPTTARVAW